MYLPYPIEKTPVLPFLYLSNWGTATYLNKVVHGNEVTEYLQYILSFLFSIVCCFELNYYTFSSFRLQYEKRMQRFWKDLIYIYSVFDTVQETLLYIQCFWHSAGNTATMLYRPLLCSQFSTGIISWHLQSWSYTIFSLVNLLPKSTATHRLRTCQWICQSVRKQRMHLLYHQFLWS